MCDTCGIICSICYLSLPSKTQLFKHLENHGYDSLYIKPDRVVILFGWLSSTTVENDHRLKDLQPTSIVDTAADAIENEIFRAIYAVENEVDNMTEVPATVERPKSLTRSSTVTHRADYIVGIEAASHGLCDTMCFLSSKRWKGSQDEWLERVNLFLPCHIRVLNRKVLPASASDFHAHTSCTQRIFEYLLPLNVIMPPELALPPSEPIIRRYHKDDAAEAWQSFDHEFPCDTPEGQARISYFRRLKRLLKQFGGRHSLHNFVSGGATPDEPSTQRRIDRVYHKDIILLNDENWVVMSISGDSFLRGEISRIMGLVIGIMRGWLPVEYLSACLCKDSIAEIPAVPTYLSYVTECKFAKFESKFPIKLDPRRAHSSGSDNLMKREGGGAVVALGGAVNVGVQDQGAPLCVSEGSALSTTFNASMGVFGDETSDRVVEPLDAGTSSGDPDVQPSEGAAVLRAYREASPEQSVARIERWSEQLHQHVADVYAGVGDDWIEELRRKCAELCTRHFPLEALQQRTQDDLTTILKEEILAGRLQSSVLQVTNSSTTSAALETGEAAAIAEGEVGDAFAEDAGSTHCATVLPTTAEEAVPSEKRNRVAAVMGEAEEEGSAVAMGEIEGTGSEHDIGTDAEGDGSGLSFNMAVGNGGESLKVHYAARKQRGDKKKFKSNYKGKKRRADVPAGVTAEHGDTVLTGVRKQQAGAGAGAGSIAEGGAEFNQIIQSPKEAEPSVRVSIRPSMLRSELIADAECAPHPYQRVLMLLRLADRSGLWPASSVLRQRVIVEDPTTPNPRKPSSSSRHSDKSAAGSSVVGSGSFSVGALPGDLPEPKGNTLFPELMRACFELERHLEPDRIPSSTIAINRHAQFKPHRDTGIGNGQSRSLIVALGDFAGGEIVVETEAHDIRYRPLQFDGWSQRHWTLPFVGERYSLVWFTPLGVGQEDLWWWAQAPFDPAATVAAQSCSAE